MHVEFIIVTIIISRLITSPQPFAYNQTHDQVTPISDVTTTISFPWLIGLFLFKCLYLSFITFTT